MELMDGATRKPRATDEAREPAHVPELEPSKPYVIDHFTFRFFSLPPRLEIETLRAACESFNELPPCAEIIEHRATPRTFDSEHDACPA